MSVSRHRTAAVFLVLALLVAAPLSLAAPPADAGVAPASPASLWSWVLSGLGGWIDDRAVAITWEGDPSPEEPSAIIDPEVPLAETTTSGDSAEDDRSPAMDPNG